VNRFVFTCYTGKDLSRIKEVWYCAAENKPVDRSDIVKGYEFGKDRYVVVEDNEIKQIAPPTAETIEIVQFVRADEVDPIFLEKSYYVLPSETVSKPYSLFLAAMNETKYYTVAKIAMHGREHVAIIRPALQGLVLHTLYYVNELHASRKSNGTATSKFTRKEMDLAQKLIETLASPFDPDQYRDRYRESLEQLIERKQHGEKIAPVKRHKVAPVIDIMDALQRSLRREQEGRDRTGPREKPQRTPETKARKKRSRTAA
jgi:DNA end-binding protein Ku